MSATTQTQSAATSQGHISVLARAAAAGHDVDALGSQRATIRTAVPVVVDMEGTAVAGIVYQADYRCEEEIGVSKLQTALTGPDPRNRTMCEIGRRNVGRFVDANAFVISTDPLPTRTYEWGDDLESGSALVNRWGDPRPEGWAPDYVHYYQQSVPYTRRDRFATEVKYGHVSMQQLRERARALGLTNLPRAKNALARTLLTSAEYLATVHLADVWPAWFHYGQELVVRADAGPMAVIVDALGDAIDAGTLAVGTYSGPFCTGVLLYDARDEPEAARRARIEACDWHDARMADLAPVIAQLKEWGHHWFFLGHPTISQTTDGPTVRYWLNGSTGGVTRDGVRTHSQPAGWYTAAELLEEKFIRDAAARQAA